MPGWSGYVDFIWAKGTNLTRFLNYNRGGPAVCCDAGPGTGNVYTYPARLPSARSSAR